MSLSRLLPARSKSQSLSFQLDKWNLKITSGILTLNISILLPMVSPDFYLRLIAMRVSNMGFYELEIELSPTN